jgi:hypothetical protein
VKNVMGNWRTTEAPPTSTKFELFLCLMDVSAIFEVSRDFLNIRS